MFFDIGFHTLKLLVNRVVTTGTTLTWEEGELNQQLFQQKDTANIYADMKKDKVDSVVKLLRFALSCSYRTVLCMCGSG